MTPFPVRAAWSCTRKSTREPLFPRRPTSSRVVRRSGRSGAPPTGPGAPGSPAGSLLRSSSWTTCVRLDHLIHEIRWSNRTQVVQAGRRRHDMRDAVPPCGTTGGVGCPGTGVAVREIVT